MLIPKKMVQESKPIIKDLSYQTGFGDSQWGGSYIYNNNFAAHIGMRIVKTDGFIKSGESMCFVGDEFKPKSIINGQVNRYLNGYAMSDDALVGFIGSVLIKIEDSGLVAAYFSDELKDVIKSIVVPEQQYFL